MRKISALLALVASLFGTTAHADFTGKDASAATITFKNPATCTSVACMPAFQMMDSTGVNSVAVKAASTPPAVTDPAAVTSTADGNLVSLGAKADAPCAVPTSATACSEIAIAKAIANVANSATPLGTFRIGYVTDDPCNNASTKVYTPINIVTAASTVVSTGVAAKKKYICALMLYPAAADNVAIIQATTATACATAPLGLIGGATAAAGIIATAQAGFVIGTGSAAVAATTLVQTDICLITSAAVQLSGVLVTVDQ